MHHNDNFYRDLPPLSSISDISNLKHYYDVPADWYIAMTDVTNSTIAIEAGRYKEVNAVAAAAIAAMMNSLQRLDMPFVFGGDGATMLIPMIYVGVARDTLIAIQRMAAEWFGLDLRISLVPVLHVLRAGYSFKVAKLSVSEHYEQAIFTGGGATYAEKLMKDPQTSALYAIEDDGGDYQGDFGGFECRWQAIPAAYAENVSLIVQVLGGDTAARHAVYDEVLSAIESIYGDNEKRHPLRIRNLRMNFNPVGFNVESRIRHQTTSLKKRLRMLRGSVLSNIAMIFDIQGWGRYKQLLIQTTDTEKFDDTLRMIISGSAAQREELRAYLAELHQRGVLVYGIHAASHSLVTCIVYDYFGRQVHFVDGFNGGYTLAAKEMKAQLAALQAGVS